MTGARQRGYDTRMDPDAPRPSYAHRTLGYVVLGWALLDLAFMRVAMRGRDATLAVVGSPGPVMLLPTVALVATLLAHVVLAWRSNRRALPLDGGGYGPASVRALQPVLGLAAAPFVLARVLGSPLGAPLLGRDGYGVHQWLRDTLPHPAGIAVHCVGIAALAMHLHQGVVAALAPRFGNRHVPVVFLGSSAFLLLWIDVLATFVTGRPLLPR